MPGNPLSIDLPEPGVTVGPEYATKLRAALLDLIDDIEAKITPDEVTVNADLSFRSSGTSYGAINLLRLGLQTQDSVLASGNSNSFFAVDGEAYFQDGAGNNVLITNSGSLAAAAGNITTTATSPVFGASGVGILWSGGDLEYQFKSGASTWAALVFGSIELRNGANTLTMSTAVTVDYLLNWPAGAAVDGDLATFAADGTIAFGKSLSGDFSVDGSLGVTGSITATSGVVCAVNQDLTVSGTGEVKHGEKMHRVSPASATGGTAFDGYHRVGASGAGFLGIQIPDGARITGFEQVLRHSATASVSVALSYFDTSSPVIINSGDSSKSCTANIWTSKIVTGLAEVVSGSRHYYVAIGNVGGTTDIGLLKIYWEMP